MRRMIAAMKASLDGMVSDAEDVPSWVEAWSEDYGLTPQIDACVLGGGMYPGYEAYWTAIQTDPGKPVWITGAPPTPAELAWAEFITTTPHYVLTAAPPETTWPQTSFVGGLDDIAALKQQPGKDIYLVGGARTVASCLDAGLVDEIRLIVHPVVAGGGKPLFGATRRQMGLSLAETRHLPGGRVMLNYAVA